MFTEFEQSLLRLWHDMRRPRQDFVWGVHFFVKNVDDLFFARRLKRRSKTTKINHSYLQISKKNVPQN